MEKPCFYFFPESRPSLGHGHLSRCLALSHQLSAIGPCRFGISLNPAARQLIESQGFETETLESESDILSWISKMPQGAILILDFKEDRPFPYVHVNESGIPLVMIDHATSARLYADMVIYPNAHFDYQNLDWDSFSGTLLAGPSYVLLRDIFFSEFPLPMSSRQGIVITFGGSDPNHLTEKVMSACNSIDPTVPIHVFIGSNFENKSAIYEQNRHSQGRFILHEQTEIYPYIRDAGLVITALGITIYECASQQTPVAIITNYESDHDDACALEKNLVLYLGHHLHCSVEFLGQKLQDLWNTPERRLKMSHQGRNLVSGHGTQNIAKEVVLRLAPKVADMIHSDAMPSDAPIAHKMSEMTSSTPHFWIIGGGLMQVPLIETAQKEGLATIVTDLSQDCACAPLADIFEPINIFDIENHIKLADRLVEKGINIVGVLAAGIDAPETMARLAQHLGLPGVDPDIAHLVNHKDLFRARLQDLGYPVPKFIVVDHSNNHRLDELIAEIGFPLIVKNTSSSGSRGTKIFTDPDYVGVHETVAIAQSVSRSGRALLEQVWVGHEVTVETLFDCDGNFYPCFITDRFFDKSQGFALEVSLRNPAQLPQTMEAELFEIAEKVARDLGITIGAAKYDMMLTPEGPRIIEMTVRLSGGFDCQYLVPASSGKQVMRAAILTAMGKRFDPAILRPTKNLVGLSVSLWPKPGKITAITGLEEARKIPGVEQIFFRSKVGDIVEPYIDCTKRVCFVIVCGDTEEAALRVIEQVKATLQIVTEAAS